METGYLQHGSGKGPFRTEACSIRHVKLDQYEAYFECRWRKIHFNQSRYWIIYKGQRINLQWEGV
jgi:hypothetical protein